jgi:hypothetical protein
VSNVFCKSLNNFSWNLLDANVLLPVLDVIKWLSLLLRVRVNQFNLLDLTEALLTRPLELGVFKEVETDVLELDQIILGTTAEERLNLAILFERVRFACVKNLLGLIQNLELSWAAQGIEDTLVLISGYLASLLKCLASVVSG